MAAMTSEHADALDLLGVIGEITLPEGRLGRVLKEAGQETLRIELLTAILDVVVPDPDEIVGPDIVQKP